MAPPQIGEEVNVTIDQGKTLLIKLLAVGALDQQKGVRDVFFELNGEVRAVSIVDNSAAVDHVQREKATREPGSVGAPMGGVIIELRVHEGQEVKEGDPLAVISAMKMENSISAPASGKISRVVVHESDSLSAGDLICEIAK